MKKPVKVDPKRAARFITKPGDMQKVDLGPKFPMPAQKKS